MKNIKLIGCIGSGSAIVEAALILSRIPYDYVEANYDNPEGLKIIKDVNPLGQVPVLVLSDGKVFTESAAIINYIQLQSRQTELIPRDHALYWRWVCFIIGSIYPSFTYGDFPERWTDRSSAHLLKESTDEWRKKLWLQVEGEVQSEYFLQSFSALDLYVAVMVNWRPGRPWFKENCPKIFEISLRVESMPELKTLWLKHFPRN